RVHVDVVDRDLRGGDVGGRPRRGGRDAIGRRAAGDRGEADVTAIGGGDGGRGDPVERERRARVVRIERALRRDGGRRRADLVPARAAREQERRGRIGPVKLDEGLGAAGARVVILEDDI